MKHFKDILSKAKTMKQETVSKEAISGKISNLADFLDGGAQNEKNAKRQNHYERLKMQQKEADYDGDWISIQTKSEFMEGQKNRTINLNKDQENQKPYDFEQHNKNTQNQSYKQHSFDNQEDLGKSQYSQDQRAEYYQQTHKTNYESQQQEHEMTKQRLRESQRGKYEPQQQQQQQEQQQKGEQQEQEINIDNDNLSMAEKFRMRFSRKPEQQAEEQVQQQNQNPKPQESGQIPFMITRTMKLSLLELGYSPEDIRGMTPSSAHEILLEAAKRKV